MRLLKLSDKVQQMLIDDMISSGHARALLGIDNSEKQYSIAQKIFDEKLSVRDTEKLVKKIENEKEPLTKKEEIIDTKSSFADWLNNKNVRSQLKLEVKICLVKNGYPPQYSPEVFHKVMEQVENFEEHSDSYISDSESTDSSGMYQFQPSKVLMVAEESEPMTDA